jgi:hypothetical protein
MTGDEMVAAVLSMTYGIHGTPTVKDFYDHPC